MKKSILSSFLIPLVLGVFLLIACNDTEDISLSSDAHDEEISDGPITSFNVDDLRSMKSKLEGRGIDVSDIDLAEQDEAQTRGVLFENPFVNAIKVTTRSLHPNRSGQYIDVSGVLLVPRKTSRTKQKNFRIIVVPPSTYTYNNSAPSIAFQRMSLLNDESTLNYLYFWTLQAQSGFVVFMPDYPGYGDSYKQCFHPYMDAEALVNSTLDLLKSAQRTLTDNGYQYKKELVISGYSQGAFVSASLAREIETNPAHNLDVSLLFIGGSPCNLKYIADEVRRSDYTSHTYLVPFALWGYKENAYPHMKVSDILKEPYASGSKSYYDGTHKELNKEFSHNPSEVYTEKFLKYMDQDPDMLYINDILDKNSVKPWVNKCDFVMTHGVDDETVYYQNAKDFAEKQKEIGGKVKFYSTWGEHTPGFIPYYIRASAYLPFYR